MLVLSSDEAEADAARFAEAGIGVFEPFSFERNGKLPNGDETRVAFSLAFARDKNAPDVGFFVCQQHHPENFWDFRFQRHVNGGTNITAVTLTTAAPEKHIAFLEPFAGIRKQSGQSGHYTFPLDGGQIDLMQHADARRPLLTSFTVQVDDVHQVAEMLAAQKIPFAESDGVVVISKSCALGVEIRLENGVDAQSGRARADFVLLERKQQNADTEPSRGAAPHTPVARKPDTEQEPHSAAAVFHFPATRYFDHLREYAPLLCPDVDRVDTP